METALLSGESSGSGGGSGPLRLFRGRAFSNRSDAIVYGSTYQKAAALVDLVSFIPFVYITIFILLILLLLYCYCATTFLSFFISIIRSLELRVLADCVFAEVFIFWKFSSLRSGDRSFCFVC